MIIDYSTYNEVPRFNFLYVIRNLKNIRLSQELSPDRYTEFGVYLFYLIFLYIIYIGESEPETADPTWVVVLTVTFTTLCFISWSVLRRLYILRRFQVVNNFAKSNNLKYYKNIFSKKFVEQPGSIFKGGYNKIFRDKISGELFEIGNYENTIGIRGYGGSRNKWGYVAIKLKRRIPHLYMAPRGNNMYSSQLNISFDKMQKQRLEGNFNDYFTLYCPDNYRRDAFYVLTPNLMQLLMDKVANYHVEIVDDMCYVYGKKIKFDNERSIKKIMAIIDELSPKIERQTKRYADEKVGNKKANIVNSDGRRLAHYKPSVIIMVIVTLFFFIVKFPPAREFIVPIIDNLFK